MLRYIRQLAGESFIYGLAGAVSALIQLFLLPLYTRVFKENGQYGTLELVLTTMNVLTLIAVLALDSSAHRWYWGSDDDSDRYRTVSTWAWANFATTTLVTIAIWCFAPWIAQSISGDPAHAPLYRIASLTLPLGVLGLVTTGWLRMRRQPKLAVSFSIGTSLLTLLLVYLLVLGLDQGLLGVFWAQALAAVGITLAGALILGRAISPVHFDFSRLREMLIFALPLVPAGLAAWVVSASGRYFVNHYLGLDAVGEFSVGLRIATVAALVTTAFQTAWGPFALSIHQKPEARQVYAAALLWYAWATGLVATSLALLGPYVSKLIAPGFTHAGSVIGLLAFSFVFIGLKFVAAVGLNIVKDNRPIGIAVTASGALFILLSVLLVPRFGLVGAALSTLISQALIPVYLFWRSQLAYPVPYNFGLAASLLGIAGGLSYAGEFLPEAGLPGFVARLALLLLVALSGLLLRTRAIPVPQP